MNKVVRVFSTFGRAIILVAQGIWDNMNPRKPMIWAHYQIFHDLREDFNQRNQTLWGRHYFNRCPLYFYGLFFFVTIVLWTFTIALVQFFVLDKNPYWNAGLTVINIANFLNFFNSWIQRCSEGCLPNTQKYWSTYAGEPIIVTLDRNDPVDVVLRINNWLTENVAESDYFICDHQYWNREIMFVNKHSSVFSKALLAHHGWESTIDRQYVVVLRKRDDAVLFKLMFGGKKLTKKKQLQRPY